MAISFKKIKIGNFFESNLTTLLYRHSGIMPDYIRMPFSDFQDIGRKFKEKKKSPKMGFSFQSGPKAKSDDFCIQYGGVGCAT